MHCQTAIFGGPVAVADYAPFGTDELAAAVGDPALLTRGQVDDVVTRMRGYGRPR